MSSRRVFLGENPPFQPCSLPCPHQDIEETFRWIGDLPTFRIPERMTHASLAQVGQKITQLMLEKSGPDVKERGKQFQLEVG
jgi:hypothetical protein